MKTNPARLLIVSVAVVAIGAAAAVPASSVNSFQAFGGAQQAGAITADDIAYTMPPGWIMQPVQAGPEVIAHYVYYRGGMPSCELYISCEVPAAPKTLDQAFQEGLAKVKPALPFYQARGTQRTTVAGLDAIVHDFSYYVAQSAAFTGRSYVFIVNGKVYNFFFNTTSGNFTGVQGLFPQILNSVQVNPTPNVAAQEGGGGGVTVGPGGGLTCEEHGVAFELPAGWAPSNDPAGAKYRLHRNGRLVGSLFVFEPNQLSAMTALFGGGSAAQLKDALAARQEGLFKQIGEYKPAETTNMKFGPFEALVHEFDFRQTNNPGFYRWYFVSVKAKEDTGTTQYPPVVHEFSIMSTALDQRGALKKEFDAIFATLRLKGATAPAVTTVAEAAGPPAVQSKPPAKKAAGALPQLAGTDTAAEAGVYTDPQSRVRIPLPPDTVIFRKEGELTSYKNKPRKAYFQFWSMKSVSEAGGMGSYATKDKKQNGAAMSWEVEGREVLVKLYTGKNVINDDVAAVTALYPEANLLVYVEVPLKDYNTSQEWIMEFLQGVHYLK
jgi:hypothetical protein